MNNNFSDMQYREIGKTGYKASAIGFGMMRLPLKDAVTLEVDFELSKTIVRYAIDHGINYIDTAYNYLGEQCERITGEILRDGYREKVYLTAKLPVWKMEKEDDFEVFLNEQLANLRTDYFDFYLLHSVTHEVWDNIVVPFKLWEKLEAAKKSGKIRHYGFSFHDNIQLFKEMVDTAPWDLCYIQLNYNDEKYQAGIEGLRYAAAKGMGVVAMEPLHGGDLAKVPQSVSEIFKEKNPSRQPVEWAFDYLWNLPELSLCISGMNQLQQVIDNIGYASRSFVGMLSADESDTIKKVQEEFKSYHVINCTGCGYCRSCPQNIDIPMYFDIYNEYKIYNDLGVASRKFNSYIGDKDGSKCISCHQCETMCPQHIKITEWLAEIVKIFRKE